MFQAKNILDIHSRVCPNFNRTIQASVDGVQEAKSNNVSLDIYSSKFHKCRYVYPHIIARPLKKGYVDNQEQLQRFLSDLSANSIPISAFVADKPKRSDIKCTLNQCALYPCEYCYAKGERHAGKRPKSELSQNAKILIEKVKRIEKSEKNKETSLALKKLVSDLENSAEKSKLMIVWPSSTQNKETRTKENMLEIIAMIEENRNNEDSEPLTKDDLKGVAGRSLLLDYDSFDFITQVPPEYMHLVCLGVVKRLTELTFNVGINRSRITKRKLSSTKEFNSLMAKTKVVFEFSRRARDLDFSVYKAEEFRNLVVFFFPHVLECIEKSAKERECWLYLSFMIRACILPDKEYFNVNNNEIKTACNKFYKIYEKLFGYSNCTYSLHVLCCHLLEIRQLGPFTETSAFKFESFYGEIRNSFTPGTTAPLKQIFEATMLKRSLSAHCCEKSTHISNYDTALQCNSLVYTYNDNVEMFKIIDIIEDVAICNPQGKYDCSFENIPDLTWSSVGVFKKGATSSEIIHIQQKEIAGKVLKVGEYLITCPDNVLKEK